ncbi:hypothetical protein BGY98DRAFT_932225 [Russula aff. rugulosa BPL654]|nr:hypothetical protein BGY98DRAFT_932225 [Russula aff. rugulosa BPL654]
MSLIYSDSFQDDEDLCNILAALQLGSRPMTVVRDPGPQAVVTQAAMSTQHGRHPVQIAFTLYHRASGQESRTHGQTPEMQLKAFTVAELPEFVFPHGGAADVAPRRKSSPWSRVFLATFIKASGIVAKLNVPRYNTGQQVPAQAMPMPEELMAAFASASDNFLGAEWYVVFKGKRPGVYPAWNFAATQTKGVSNSIFNKFSSKADAEAAYRRALDDDYVEIL